MPEPNFDVAVIGGGASGSAAALTLLQGGVSRVAIVEKSEFTEPRIGETIPPDTNLLLHQLGVKADFLEQGHLPCYGSHSLWGSDRLGHNDFLVSPYGHGWHLDRVRFDKLLFNDALKAGAVHINGSCTSVDTDSDRISKVEVDGAAIFANWFIDATGRQAMLSRACGVARELNDRQTVIWARFQVPPDQMSNATWLEAVPEGWWYGAELPDQQAVIALGTDPHVAKSLGLYSMPTWAVALSDTTLIAPKLASARMIPDSFNITASHSYLTQRVVGENWAAIGDAASAFDPLSSAGIYKGLATGQKAADAIITGNDALERYQDYIKTSYAEYLDLKHDLYTSERRWSDHPFWMDRHRLADDIIDA